jgi:hypothetical protein
MSLPAGTDPGDAACLTEDEAPDLFPAVVRDLRPHGLLCPGAWFGIPQEEWEEMAAPR